MPAQTISTPVLVVGAGPVGSVLALELARHGVPSMVVERSVMPSPHPKTDLIGGRSMELLRRLGLDEPIRRRGVPGRYPMNVVWTQGFDRPPVHVWRHPSPDELRRRYGAVTDGSTPAQPYQRVPGTLLEELARDAVRRHPLIDLREGWTVVDLAVPPEGTRDPTCPVTVLDAAARTRYTVAARYVAGCDGVDSTVRRCLEIPVEEWAPRTQHCSVTFVSADPVLRRYGRAYLTIASRGLTLVSRDEADTWTATVTLPADEPFAVDPMALVRDRLGADFTVDHVLGVAQWEGALDIASAYRKGPVYLVGDAAHRYHPLGGHGANLGIADAVDLGWKLAGAVSGWGGPHLLDSYEIERRPVALLYRELAAATLETGRRFGRLSECGVPRETVAGILKEESRQLDDLGVQYGLWYADSPVVCNEPAGAPGWRWDGLSSTAWPGGRVPAPRLADGSLLLDRLGTGYTLVDLTDDRAGEPLVREAEARGVPVTHLPLTDPVVRAHWGWDLVLVRPDQHVAWRGVGGPSGWAGVLDRVTGNATTRTRDAARQLADHTRA